MQLAVDVSHEFSHFSLSIAFDTAGARVTALFGPSGSGKTTLLRAIAGLLLPSHGTITLEGNTLLDTARRTNVPPQKRRLGCVFQEARLFPHLTVRANLYYGRKRADKPMPQHEVDHIISILDLDSILQRRPRGLSGGERQRVAIGRALISGPELLLLDEPLASLDAARRAEILPYLERLASEARTPMLYVSHAVEEVARIADRVVLIDDGHVTMAGETAMILSQLDAVPGDPGSVLHARILEHDDAYDLTRVDVEGHLVTVPRLEAAIDDHVRLRVRASDVLLATQSPSELSANTILPGSVEAIAPATGPFVDVRISIEGFYILSRITKKSAERLQLRPGTHVFAIVKTATLLR
jgi:molybdate transport system ATP-binding protein